MAPTGKEVSGANIESPLAVLTDREREIMRLVSEGLSNKAIARQLNISQGTIKVHLHHIYQKLEINNRTVLAALAISQRYGGFGTLSLAALTCAAMDDAANPYASKATFVASSPREDATADETVLDGGAYDVSRAHFRGALYLNGATGVYTYVPGNDTVNALAAPTAETCAITVSHGTLSGSQTYNVTIGAANAAPGTPSATGQLDSDIYNTANTFTAASSTRPSLGGYGTFMMTAAGVWTYALDNANSAAQALDVGDTRTNTFTVTTASGTEQVVTVTIRGSIDADLNDFDPLGDRGISEPPFVFGTSRGDTIAGGGHEFQIVHAGAGEEDTVNGTGKDDPLYAGSGNDRFRGNDGNDTIYGGPRTVNDNNGADTFVYLAATDSSSAQFDSITDFKFGSDRIDLAAFGALAFMALSATAKTVPPHTIASIYDSASNQTIVYVNQTNQALDIGDSALLEIYLQGDAFAQDSDFVHEPATATVAATGEAIDPALAAMTAGDVLTASGAEASVEATVSEAARVTDSIWTTSDESFSFRFVWERVDSTSSAQLASLDQAPGHATEDGRDDAVTLVRGSSVELPRGHATGPVEDHSRFDQGPIHASTVAMTTRDVAATLAGGTIDHGGLAVAPGSGANPGQSQRELHAVSADASNNSHSESNPNAASKDQSAPADAGHAEMAAAPVLGDSFQFKSEMAASKHSDAVADVGNGPASTSHDWHAGHNGLAAIQDTEPPGLSLAEQYAADHAGGAQHHVPHDLIV
ncbi:hypothetical protein LMTR3_09180 [Bradyrhizobium sp. LMTR 3]|nr:hypothetical protein LMTR3_09180 [Bradyrhizobium sp. LMTR 3]